VPTYTFRDPKTGNEWTEVCLISEMEEKEAQGFVVVPAAPFIGDMVRQGLKKPSDGFRDILRNIKRKHRGGKRNDNSAGINTF
jgi:hypothetical protein